MRLVALGVTMLVLAGCSESPPSTDDEEPIEDDGRGSTDGSGSSVILDVQGASTQFDILCTFGGGPEMQRAGGRVLNGTDHLAATVGSSMTTTGVQLGYVITESPGYDEVEQDGITWLPTVRDGEETFEVAVPADGIETSDGPLLWHFYQRVNLLGGETEQDCYTGIHDGDMKLYVEAIRD